jgi:antitoxin component HigA of HigAB toxin-antitoxin module
MNTSTRVSGTTDTTTLINTWENLPATARITRPTTESEFTSLLELLDSITDRMDARGDTPSNSPLTPLFELTLEYVSAWEREHEEPITASPREMLEELMRERNISQKDLERAGVAKQALLSVVLSGKRGISLGLARKLAGFFKVSIEVLI